jgi:hypothetical protein
LFRDFVYYCKKGGVACGENYIGKNVKRSRRMGGGICYNTTRKPQM